MRPSVAQMRNGTKGLAQEEIKQILVTHGRVSGNMLSPSPGFVSVPDEFAALIFP